MCSQGTVPCVLKLQLAYKTGISLTIVAIHFSNVASRFTIKLFSQEVVKYTP